MLATTNIDHHLLTTPCLMRLKKTAQQLLIVKFQLISSGSNFANTFYWGGGVLQGQEPLLLLPTAASECPNSLPLSLTHAEINCLARVWQQAGL